MIKRTIKNRNAIVNFSIKNRLLYFFKIERVNKENYYFFLIKIIARLLQIMIIACKKIYWIKIVNWKNNNCIFFIFKFINLSKCSIQVNFNEFVIHLKIVRDFNFLKRSSQNIDVQLWSIDRGLKFFQSISTSWAWQTMRIRMALCRRPSIESWKVDRPAWWWQTLSRHLSNADCTSGIWQRCQKMHSTVANEPCSTVPLRIC